jgi:hypothetical protein
LREFGPEGANGVQLVTAVLASGNSFGAWVWDQDDIAGGPSGDPTGLNNFGLLSGGALTTQFGVPVAAAILANSKKTT